MNSNTLITLKKEMKRHLKDNRVLLCVGSNKCVGDSLGPLVGEILSRQLKEKNIEIIGNMKKCVDYCNIPDITEEIHQKYTHPYIITIDAALAKKEYIGRVVTIHEKLVLGSALGKENYQIGNIGIKGIVAEKKETLLDNFISLNTVPRKRVISLAFHISNQIYDAITE